MEANEAEVRPGEVVAAKYRVVRCLEQSSGRASYLARDTLLERDVVLTFGSAVSPEARARLEQAAQALAKLSHPNVVAVHEIGEAGGRVFVVTEHIGGDTARAWLVKKPRSWRAIVTLYRAAGGGLAAAHTAGIAHGNFSADKVLVSDDGRPRVADFQGARGDADAARDLRDFSSALWEALYGGSPLGVPRRVERALRRGRSPEVPWPSLNALLDELGVAAAPSRTKRTLAGVLGVLALGVALFVVVERREARAFCAHGASELGAVWNEARAAAIGRSFEAVGGAATWASLRPVLERHAASWVATHQQACSATRIERVQSEALMQSRMLCLSRARAQLDALLDSFASADRSVVARAPQEVGLLYDLAACSDAVALKNQTPPPSDPAARAAIERVYKDVAELRVSHLRGDERDPTAAGDRALDAARGTGWAPLIANASWVRATLLLDAGKLEPGFNGLKDAASLAIASGDDDTAAWVMADLGWHYADARRSQEAATWLELARAIWTFRGEKPALGNRILAADALLDYALGKPKDMLAHRLASIELGKRAYGDDPLFVANCHVNLAGALQSNARFEDAVRELTQAVSLFEASFGAAHPTTARALRSLAENETQLGNYKSASEHATQAIERLEAWYGPTDPRLVEALDTLAVIHMQRGELTEARATYDRELRLLPAGDPRIPDAQTNICAMEAMAGHDAEAVKFGELALAAHAQALGADNPLLATDLINLGSTYRHMGNLVASESALRRAVHIVEAGSGPSHPDLVNPSIELGDTLLATKRPSEALAVLTRAMSIVEADATVTPPLAADAYRAYAEALYSTDHARARAAAVTARDRFGALGADFEPRQKQVTHWLSTHP